MSNKDKKAQKEIVKESRNKISKTKNPDKDKLNTATHTKKETDTPQFTRRDRSANYRAATK